MTWMVFKDVTLSFRMMIDQPTSPDMDLTMSLIERYVVLLYDRTNLSDGVNEARKNMFLEEKILIEAIPTTRSSLFQQVKRAIYHGGCE